MDVLAVAEGFQQGRILRDMGQHAQLHLRIVGRDQQTARPGDEAGAHALAQRPAHGDVLQIGIAGGEPPRGRGLLVEGGMDAALRVHQARQGIEIGGTHLLQFAVLEDAVHHGMLPGQFLQRLLAGGSLAALGLARRGQAQPVE